jgi:hypothetical protein
MNWIIISFIIFIIVIIISIWANNSDKKRYINLTDDNEIDKLIKLNYKYLEIKRKRRAQNIRGAIVSSIYYECALEYDYPVPGSVIPPEDIIEIYGVEYNNRKYLIYKTYWSKDNAKNIKKIVEEINNKYDIRQYCT